MGYAALFNNTMGTHNVAIGAESLYSNKDGSESTAIGAGALYKNNSTVSSSGYYRNTAVGYQSMYNTDGGFDNASVGMHSMLYNTTGSNNAALGVASLYFNKTGNYNTAIGPWSCSQTVAGSGNVCLGWQSGPTSDVNNRLYIDNSYHGGSQGDNSLITGDFAYRWVKINSGASGTVLFGSDPSLPYTNYDMNFDGGSDGMYAFNNVGVSSGFTSFQYRGVERFTIYNGGGAHLSGPLYVDGSISASGTITPSDKRLKDIFGDHNIGLEQILKLNVKEYTFKKRSDRFDGRKHTGVVAQELQKIIPNAVVEGPGNGKYKSLLYIDQSEILFTCVNAIKQLYSKIVRISTQVSDLSNRISKLENENKILKNQVKELRLQREKDQQLFHEINRRLSNVENIK